MRIKQEEMPLEKYEYESNILLGCDWAIGLGAIDKGDNILKIFVIWIYWTENCSEN